MTFWRCFFLFATLFLLFFNSCFPNPEKIKEDNKISKKYKQIAQQKYNSNIKYIYNSSKSHVICINQEKTPKNVINNPNFMTNFFIYDIKKNTIVFEDFLNQGIVKWINDNQVEVFNTPGIVKGDESHDTQGLKYIYDISLKKKIKNIKPIEVDL